MTCLPINIVTSLLGAFPISLSPWELAGKLNLQNWQGEKFCVCEDSDRRRHGDSGKEKGQRRM